MLRHGAPMMKGICSSWRVALLQLQTFEINRGFVVLLWQLCNTVCLDQCSRLHTRRKRAPADQSTIILHSGVPSQALSTESLEMSPPTPGSLWGTQMTEWKAPLFSDFSQLACLISMTRTCPRFSCLLWRVGKAVLRSQNSAIAKQCAKYFCKLSKSHENDHVEYCPRNYSKILQPIYGVDMLWWY